MKSLKPSTGTFRLLPEQLQFLVIYFLLTRLNPEGSEGSGSSLIRTRFLSRTSLCCGRIHLTLWDSTPTCSGSTPPLSHRTNDPKRPTATQTGQNHQNQNQQHRLQVIRTGTASRHQATLMETQFAETIRLNLNV